MATKEAIKEQLHLKAILGELTSVFDVKCLDIHTASNMTIEDAKTPVYRARTKHVDI